MSLAVADTGSTVPGVNGERRHVRLWLRALIDRYEKANMHEEIDSDQLFELSVAEDEIQTIFEEVGLILTHSCRWSMG